LVSHSPSPEAAANRVEIAFPSDATVSLLGEHDLAQQHLVRHALDTASTRRRHVLVNLSNCAFLDSTVINLLLRAQADVTSREGHFALIVPDAETRIGRVLDLMRLGDALPIYATLNQALASIEHAVRIRDLRARFGDPDAFAAECTCGWKGELRTGVLAMRRARGDANDHTGYERPARVR
jgi:anti-anti-sigma factor